MRSRSCDAAAWTLLKLAPVMVASSPAWGGPPWSAETWKSTFALSGKSWRSCEMMSGGAFSDRGIKKPATS